MNRQHQDESPNYMRPIDLQVKWDSGDYVWVMNV